MTLKDKIKIEFYKLSERILPVYSKRKYIVKEILLKRNFKAIPNIFTSESAKPKKYISNIVRTEGKKTILIIDHKIPEYDKDAGSNTILGYIKIMAESGLNILFISDDRKITEPYCKALKDIGVNVFYGPFNFKRWIKKNGGKIDYVLLSRPYTALRHIDNIGRFSGAKLYYYTHDLHFLRELRKFNISRNKKDYNNFKKFKAIEYYIFEKSDIVLTPSVQEKEYLDEDFKNIVVFPPYYYDSFLDKYRISGSFKKRTDIMFLGNFDHKPNVDAVLWFSEKIFPVIKEKIPSIKLYVIGANPTDAVIKLSENEDIAVTGYVNDLTEYFEKARVFIAPLRYGAGIKGKIITALYYGIPVVSTSVGMEGIGLINFENILIADEPESFADYVSLAYSDEKLWSSLSYNSMNFVENNYNKDILKNEFEKLFKINEKMNG